MQTKLFSQHIRNGLEVLADILYPRQCLSCGQISDYICAKCQSYTPTFSKYYCVVCEGPSANGHTHLDCTALEPHSPKRLIPMFRYQNELVATAIITGKYYFVPRVFRLLTANWLANITLAKAPLAKTLNHFDYITAIPLHPRKLKWRGFNQSEVIGKVIAEHFKLPYLNLLERNRPTKTQKDLNKEARILNMSRCFSISEVRVSPRRSSQNNATGNEQNLAGKRILLVDDVITTGTTLKEAAKVLYEHGASDVSCITLATDN